MTELNKDGLEPGQQVDLATLQRIERARKAQPAPEPEVYQARRKPGRPKKQQTDAPEE